ncbi:methyl-accepting chemotaxis protein [Pseudomonas sp. CCI1.2]|nr:methyl-accepting chemotaxis protein [Pseudomonas sp. CCI1.2]MEB0123910.1 methyl-accepting chemotaxis protein [Pseudomonas sp. CCI1.2]
MPVWRKSIQWQLTLSMGAALVISSLIVIAIYAFALNRLTDRYLLQQAMPASVEAIRNDLERLLASPLTAASDIADNTLVEDWLRTGEDPAQQATFVRYLANIQQQHKALTTFIVAKDSGHYFTNKGVDRTLQPGAKENGWFYDFLASGKPRALEIDIDQTTRVPTLFINQRIESNGIVVGVAGLGFSLSALSEMVRNFHFDEHGQVYLVSPDGKVKVHPNADFNDRQSLEQLVGAGPAHSLLGATTGKTPVEFERNGQAFVALAAPVDSLGWTLVSEVPLAEVYGPAKDALTIISAISLAVVLCFLGFVAWIARGIVRPIRQVTTALIDIGGGDGDLTRRLDDHRENELGDLARGFNRFIGSLHELIGDALTTSEQLRQSVGDVARVVENTSTRAVQQQQMTDMVATAVHEMGLTVQEIARNAGAAAQVSRSTQDQAVSAKRIVGQSIAHIQAMSDGVGSATGAVEALATKIANIDQVLTVIRSISEQTNLLALNAAIEAARAGELGRGFAVVADEVRTLAGRTQSATGEIQQMIGELKGGADQAVASMRAGQAATGTGVEASRRTGDSLDAIAGHVEELTDRNHQVAAATEQQSSVTEEINRNVQGIADLAQSTAKDVQICREDCLKLSNKADHLASQMARFKL